MKYYLAGYFLIRLKPLSFGSQQGKFVYTASECINELLLDRWSFSFDNDQEVNDPELQDLMLPNDTLFSIKNWTAKKVGQHKIVGFKLFYTKTDALEYRELFFSDCEDARLIALSFGEDQAKSIIGNENLPADIALKQMLANQIEESTTGKHTDLGFDLIGIEDAGDFHSYHCHDLANQLQLKFNLPLNQ